MKLNYIITSLIALIIILILYSLSPANLYYKEQTLIKKAEIE